VKCASLLLTVLLTALLVAGCGGANGESAPTAADEPSGQEMAGMEMASTGEKSPAALPPVTSEQGLFVVQATSQLDPLAINQLHAWILHVETPDGQPVEGATITVDGGMPAHNHGLPTEPQVTEELGNGDYRLEGMKFSMPGLWEIRVTITAGGKTDTAVLTLTL